MSAALFLWSEAGSTLENIHRWQKEDKDAEKRCRGRDTAVKEPFKQQNEGRVGEGIGCNSGGAKEQGGPLGQVEGDDSGKDSKIDNASEGFGGQVGRLPKEWHFG